MFLTACTLLGAFVAAYHALGFLNLLFKTLFASGPKITQKYGEWAVVTGATDGVGKALCFELARKGCRCTRAGRATIQLASPSDPTPSVVVLRAA